jgi:hypothetical protein
MPYFRHCGLEPQSISEFGCCLREYGLRVKPATTELRVPSEKDTGLA